LVYKNDVTLRLCIDYRALNSINVKNSFLFPTINELIDELFSAAYFLKLEL